MTYDDEITLISFTYGENNIGDPINIENKTTVLASELDYRNKDFYQAMANGLKPSKTFAINKYEYNNEESIEHNKRRYKVIDIFPVKIKNESEFETIALICEGVVNNAFTT